MKTVDVSRSNFYVFYDVSSKTLIASNRHEETLSCEKWLHTTVVRVHRIRNFSFAGESAEVSFQ